MERSNVDAVYEEYPFISDFLLRVRVSGAQVKRWSEDFLATTPDSYPGCGSEKIYLLDASGGEVAKVDTWPAYFRNGTKETVGQALARIGCDKARTVRYALGIWNGRVILWRLPKGYRSALDWSNSTVAKARKYLRQSQ